MNGSHTDGEPTKIGCGPIVPIAVLLLIVALVGYVLSIGPAAYLVHHDVLPEQPLGYFYFPIVWIAQNNEPTAEFLIWYLNLWVEIELNK